METKNKQLDEQKNQQKNGSGSLLANARKKQNRTVEEIADELNLSVTQIQTIELDQNEGLPEPTYVRGYIRSYAKLLGLDAEKVLESYLNPNWQKTSSLDDMPKGIGNADESNAGGFFSPGKLVGLLFIILIAAFLWFSGLLTSFISADKPPKVEDVSQQVDATSAQNSVDEPDQIQRVEEQNEAPVTQAQLEPEQSATVIDAQVEPEAQQEPDVVKQKHSLKLTFIQTCWVDIRDGNDKRLAFKNYYAGEELNVSNDERLHIFLGNAEGVSATYNGEPFDMTPYKEGVYAKFSFGKK